MTSRRVFIALLVGLHGCGQTSSVLEPAGEGAHKISGLWWLMFWLGLAVWCLVVGALAAATFRRRDREPTRWSGIPLVTTGGLFLPALVILPLSVVVLIVSAALSNAPRGDERVIDVVANQFWWEVRYDADAVTANEVHVPIGEPVVLRLHSADVIHSFWVPNVAGKVDLIPGETTTLRIRVDREGVYEGFCAEFCGIQHARMRFLLVAQSPREFSDWLDLQRQPAGRADAAASRGAEVFQETGCATCHTVRGTAATGRIGPDLTHLASRRTIAANTLPNTRGHLAGWVSDPQAIKPGNPMPAQVLDPEELRAILDYLESLE